MPFYSFTICGNISIEQFCHPLPNELDHCAMWALLFLCHDVLRDVIAIALRCILQIRGADDGALKANKALLQYMYA